MGNFNIIRELRPGHVFYKIEGELYLLKQQDLEKRLIEDLEKENRLVMDFTEMEFIDSTGIGLITHLCKKAEEKNVQIFVIEPSGALNSKLLQSFLESFRKTGLLTIFENPAEYNELKKALEAQFH